MPLFKSVHSLAIPLDMDNVDTDMIIPAQFLTKVDKQGYGEHLFSRLKAQDPEFIFNDPAYKHAHILLSKANFGCGSSREHAVWAIVQAGIKVIIAQSYSDIFYSNASKNGLLTISLEPKMIAQFMQKNISLTVDLEKQTVTTPDDESFSFDYDPFLKECLLTGQDDLDYLLEATQ